MKMSSHSPKCLLFLFYVVFFFSFWQSYFLKPNPCLSFPWFSLALGFKLLTGGSSAPSSLKQQQEGHREQVQQATEAGSGHGRASDSVVVWRVGVQSRSAPRTLTTYTHPASRAADVITWKREMENTLLTKSWNTYLKTREGDQFFFFFCKEKCHLQLFLIPSHFSGCNWVCVTFMNGINVLIKPFIRSILSSNLRPHWLKGIRPPKYEK